MTEPRRASKIMVIRHAEKPARNPPPYGVSMEGTRDSESLTVRGWQRAGALAVLFAPHNKSVRGPALAEPQFIYASRPTKRGGSKRSLETVTAIAERLALRINANFRRDDAELMLEEAFLCDGVVLICWQQEIIPDIANYIVGKNTTTPQDWPDDRFDMIWVFDLEPDSGLYNFQQVPMDLLMGDWLTPIR